MKRIWNTLQQTNAANLYLWVGYRKVLADKILISNKLFPWTQTYQISAKKKKKVETSVLFFQTLSTVTSLVNLPRRCAQSRPSPCAVWIPSTLAVRLRNNLCPFPPQCWCCALTGNKTWCVSQKRSIWDKCLLWASRSRVVPRLMQHGGSTLPFITALDKIPGHLGCYAQSVWLFPLPRWKLACWKQNGSAGRDHPILSCYLLCLETQDQGPAEPGSQESSDLATNSALAHVLSSCWAGQKEQSRWLEGSHVIYLFPHPHRTEAADSLFLYERVHWDSSQWQLHMVICVPLCHICIFIFKK